ncbi:MAG: winged helix family two component transcriptional regulator [Bacteroidetes bacterium]|nr:MAG: winged helix family two component transcriptional regulator [Bacteroidota bacterium]
MEKKARILYVEDDLTLSFVTRDNLVLKGYEVAFADDGIKALEMIRSGTFDLYILDVMLPGMDGFSLAGKIRDENIDTPIIFLTARSFMEDRIQGLQLGADDYITKPFSIEELVLKIEVFLRRSKIVPLVSHRNATLKLGSYSFDLTNQQLIHSGKTQPLTFRESELIRLFADNMNQIVKREDILMKVWGNDQYFSSRSLDVFISRIRKLLKSDPTIKIENIHNIGYRMKIG